MKTEIKEALEKCLTEIEWALKAFKFAKHEETDRGNCYFQLEQAADKARAALGAEEIQSAINALGKDATVRIYEASESDKETIRKHIAANRHGGKLAEGGQG